ncbi:MAG TPA: DUF4331 domain-containing protein [Thermoanaerobaculia bacterium]|nr:DUF4331 domain-containing protein [Thermoanaerobaculia bacterium]
MIKKRITQLLCAVTLAVPMSLLASSHREAPLITEDPTADNTDVYAFRSPDAPDTVTIIANFSPLSEASNAPNFYSFSNSAVYEIHIDNNGDANEDVTYQFRFRRDVRNLDSHVYNSGPVLTPNSANLNVRQFYTVNRVTGNRRSGTSTSLGGNFQVAPANIGPKSTPDYASLAQSVVGGLVDGTGKVFAGPRDDPFFVDIGSIGDLLTLRPVQQLHLVAPISPSSPGVDGLRGYNVMSIAIQVPITQLTAGGTTPGSATASNAVIGVWSTSSRGRLTLLNTNGIPRTSLSGLAQVSRLSHPLVNELVIPLRFKDIFNSSEPKGDKPLFDTVAGFRNAILDPEVPKLLKIFYNIDSPPAPRNDLVQVYLTGIPGATMPPNVVPAEMLRLNVAVPVTAAASINRMGVIAGDLGGFPNGRRLADDVVDITLQVFAGKLVPGFDRAPNNALTDGVNTNDKAFLATFPYTALPLQGFESRPHANNNPNTP